ncbi:hypothetical protein MTR67_025338 [Solanum verrucosum]|uniref:Glycosyltransferase family 28 N-terminal domain-containing protein n=1 Tax=Solanum verrucosum TaxID=315347 RepID=A0AAF0R0M7_SOLVR|nr:hypothetical protein MTR67_025338 [Solanum verrucosum]
MLKLVFFGPTLINNNILSSENLENMDHQKQTSPEVPMAEPSTKFDRRSSSSSSGEVSVTVKKENDINTAGAGADVDSREEAVGGSASNGVTNSSGTPGMELTRVKTLPSEKPQSPSDHLKLERSKTEKPTHSSGFAQEAAKIFDDKISEQQKLKLLKRIATVKDDGTVEFEIPGDVETTEVLGTGSESVHTAVEDEPLDATELQYFPPMQIVILIVGTRGDVQPFTAIGKRLQDFGHRVRLATHANFKEFVLSAGLEFYPLGGDPKILAEWPPINLGIERVELFVCPLDTESSLLVILPFQAVLDSVSSSELFQSSVEFYYSLDLPIIEGSSKAQIPSLV